VLGRQKKHLGDLSLQAGLPAEAWNYYQAGFLTFCYYTSGAVLTTVLVILLDLRRPLERGQ